MKRMVRRPPGLLNRLLGRSDLLVDDEVLTRRWQLLSTRWGGLRLHHIVRSDPVPEHHDHPFWYVSLILRGGYEEHQPLPPPSPQDALTQAIIARWSREVGRPMEMTFWRPPGSLLVRRASFLHRVGLRGGRAAWTLVLHGPRTRRWGFQTIEGAWLSAGEFFTRKATS